ncbi:MAG TPA: TolC family protein [Bacteroidetes bacterium]|nr:TolC family protein [Bacteroidota bacterium]
MEFSKITFLFGKKVLSAALLLSVFSLSLSAQDTWSLQRCIEYAKDNSLILKQAGYAIQNAALLDKQNRLARMPTINGSSSVGFQFGLNVDPTTNTLRNQRITFNSFGINASVPLYNGGIINNSIRQGEYDVKAAQADAAFAFNNIALNIANAYLQILMAEEQLENAQKRRELSNHQLEQTDKLIRAGTLPENDRLEVLAQIARDEQLIIQSENLIDINYLNLKEFMQLDPDTEIKVEAPGLGLPSDIGVNRNSFSQVYGTAVGNQPQVLRDEMRLKSAELSVDLAKGRMMPSLVLFGGMDTRWSSAGKRVTKVETVRNESIFYINDMPVEVGIDRDEFTFGNNPYLDQLNENFGQNIGVQLQVPIYNNGRNQINTERAKVGILNAKVQSDLTKQQLKTDVQNAIASVRAAQRTYAAAQKTVEAASASFKNSQKQYELGAINTFQFTTARNTLDMAEVDLIVAKYDYIFRSKIIDFYLGKKLEIH